MVPQHAEAAYRRAIQIAQKQQAKMFELRATTSLAQLWLKQGKSAESREFLAQAYGWFTEGLGMPDLKNAQALLEASSSESTRLSAAGRRRLPLGEPATRLRLAKDLQRRSS